MGNRARRRIAAVAAASWLLATAVTSLVVWRAVAAFGDGTSTSILSSPQVVERLNAATATSTATPDAQTQTPTASSPSASSDDTPDASTPASPATTATTRTPPRSTGSTGSAPVADPTPSATQVVTTWTIAGGTVSVSCQAQVISLVYASPQDGWRVEIEKRGPDSVDVDLQREGQGTKLNAICVNGVAQETVEANEGHD